MDPADKKNSSKRLICLCNGVSRSQIEAAIAGGCHSLGRIFDETQAGVGACGGSCQPTLRKILDTYLSTGEFPENPLPPRRRRRLPR